LLRGCFPNFGRLEICFRVTPNVGSNPTLSVVFLIV
jgi:hypothetical protein